MKAVKGVFIFQLQFPGGMTCKPQHALQAGYGLKVDEIVKINKGKNASGCPSGFHIYTKEEAVPSGT